MKKKKTNWFLILIVLILAVPLLAVIGGLGTIKYVQMTGKPDTQIALREFLAEFKEWGDWYWPWEERPSHMKLPPLLTNFKYYFSNVVNDD